MRTFIHYDEEGAVVAVVQTESLPEGVGHPFYIEDERHGVLEVTGDEKAGWHTGGDIGRDFKVDVAKRKLVGKSAPKRTKSEPTRPEVTTKASASESATTEATPAKAVTTKAATKTATKTPTKTPTKKPETKKPATKKAVATKTPTKKAAAKKGKRSSGSK